MRRLLLAATCLTAAISALPDLSRAQTAPPTQDSVVVADVAPLLLGTPPIIFCINVDLQAHSGPEGENPTGEVTVTRVGILGVFGCRDGSVPLFGGRVTCLAVHGNEATIGAAVLTFPTFFPYGVLISVTDNGAPGAGQDRIAVGDLLPSAPTDCTDGGVRGTIPGGEITVIDAQPFPTSKDQCKGDGWKQFGLKNQGQCIAFVNHGP
jgi:hypothetical protein